MDTILLMLELHPAKDLRDVCNKGACTDNYHAYLQKLKDEIADRKQDMEDSTGLKSMARSTRRPTTSPGAKKKSMATSKSGWILCSAG